jgi:hypothetical protein
MGSFPGGNLIKLSPSDLTGVAHTSGDVIFAKAELKNAVPSRGGCSILMTVTMHVEGAVADDDLTLLFFDNSTDLGEPVADPSTDITADEFRTASCIGVMKFDGKDNSVNVGTGYLYSNTISGGTQISHTQAGSPIFIKAEEGKTSIWVACISHGGTLDLADDDSITCTFGFKYLG